MQFLIVLSLGAMALAAPDQLQSIRDLPNDQEPIGFEIELMFNLFGGQEQQIETVDGQEAEIANLKRNVPEPKAEGRKDEKAYSDLTTGFLLRLKMKALQRQEVEIAQQEQIIEGFASKDSPTVEKQSKEVRANVHDPAFYWMRQELL